MKAKIFFLFVLFCVAYSARAQTMLLHVDETTEPAYDKGPNQKKFTHVFFKMGFFTPPEEKEAQIVYGSSASFAFGVRKKYKIGSVYSLGWQMQLEYCDYKIKTDTSNDFYAGFYETQRFDIGSFTLGFFNRFNLDPNRGNFMGTYVDLGIDGKYSYSMTEVFKYKTGYGDAITQVSGLNYVNHIHAELFARIGYSRLNLFVSYRITDLFKASSTYSELPRTCAGIEVGLY